MYPKARAPRTPIRVCYLWRRRHHAGAYSCDINADRRRDFFNARGASDLCQRNGRRGRRGRQKVLGHRSSSYRGSAGDAPVGQTQYEPHPGGYAYAADLVRGLKRIGNFEISVAAYPEGHPTALSADIDLDNLKRKIDAGANRAITQYFFDTETYLRFLDRCGKAGISVPVVPGILPVTNFGQVVKFSAMCGASVPAWMGRLFEGLDEDAETRRMVATVVAAEQVRLLQANGVDEFHFYTLNRPDLVYAIAHLLGARSRSR